MAIWPEPVMAIARVLAARRGGDPADWLEDAVAAANVYVLSGGAIMTLSQRNLAMIRGEVKPDDAD